MINTPAKYMLQLNSFVLLGFQAVKSEGKVQKSESLV